MAGNITKVYKGGLRMNIMTWNTALTEGSDVNKVIDYIKEYLDKDDLWKETANGEGINW